MVRTKNTLSFTALLTNLSATLHENGLIRVIHLTLPNFTTATEVHQIDVLDDDGAVVYTSTTGWAEDTTHTIPSLTIPVDKNYTIKITLDGAAGGAHDVVVKTYIETVK